jgi:predicted esterase
VRIVQIPTTTHGRVLIEDAPVSPSGTIVAFHGYGHNAEDILRELQRVPGIEAWRRIAPQALHRFYTRDSSKVIASWMTREDRELAIADNVGYVDHMLDQALGPRPKAQASPSAGEARPGGAGSSPEPRASSLVFLGFSQGASMAYRAAVLGKHRVTGIVALAGDVPPELRSVPAIAWPRVLVAGGTRDEWFTPKLDADLAFFAAHNIQHDVLRFDGAHEWTDDFCRAVGQFLRTLHS